MHCDDLFNPKFVHYSPVRRDELDRHGVLPRTRLVEHIDRAIDAWYSRPDASDLETVRDLTLESLGPVFGPALLRIDLWVERIDERSCVFGFLCSGDDGAVPHARGERVFMKLRSSPWSDSFREKHETLLKELPAYA